MGQIELKGVNKSFGNVHIIHNVDLKIEDGSFVVFVGPSGCGKSTLLRLIAGLEDVTSGRVMIDGVDVSDVPPAKRGLSMVFQSYALYPHMSVRGNIGFGLKMAGAAKSEINQKVEAAAATLNLTPYLERKPRDPGLHVSRGKARLATRDGAGAKDDFNRAIEIDPKLAPELAPLLHECDKSP